MNNRESIKKSDLISEFQEGSNSSGRARMMMATQHADMFDHDLFTLVWGPTLAALSYVFDKSRYKHFFFSFSLLGEIHPG